MFYLRRLSTHWDKVRLLFCRFFFSKKKSKSFCSRTISSNLHLGFEHCSFKCFICIDRCMSVRHGKRKSEGEIEWKQNETKTTLITLSSKWYFFTQSSVYCINMLLMLFTVVVFMESTSHSFLFADFRDAKNISRCCCCFAKRPYDMNANVFIRTKKKMIFFFISQICLQCGTFCLYF